MKFKSVRTVIILTVIAVVFTVQAALVFITGKTGYEESLNARLREMSLLANTISKSLGDFGSQLSIIVRGASSDPRARNFLMGRGNASDAAAFLSAISKAAEEINVVYLFDTSGQQVSAQTEGHDVGKAINLAGRQYITEALHGKPSFSAEPYISQATNKLIVSVTAPVFDDSGNVIGGVGMSYIISGIIHNYITTVKLGENGFPFILSPAGVMVAHPDKSLLLKNVSQEPGMKDVHTATVSEPITYEKDNAKRVITWANVPNWGWKVCVTMPYDEIEKSAVNQRNITTLFGILSVVIISVITVILLEKIVVNPIRKLESFSSQVETGNFGAALDVHSVNEIGRLAHCMRNMVASLKNKISEADLKTELANHESAKAAQAMAEAEQARVRAEQAKAAGMQAAAEQLRGIVDVVSSASEELSTQIEHSSRGADEQANRVRETATAMEEMNATVLEVAKNAQQAAQLSNQAKQQALEGSQAVNDAIKGIESVHNQSIAMKQDMDDLGKQADSIGQILSVIADIADQTNLLALNAAIEAARAGDAGRGFAVVADEVRKLAEKTVTATKEVGQAIAAIQNGTQKNISNVEQAGLSIEAATNLSVRSGESLNRIIEFVHMVNDQVQSIATASEQQSAASEEINHSVEQVAAISAETAQAMEDAAMAVADLAVQSQSLQRLIDEMKRQG